MNHPDWRPYWQPDDTAKSCSICDKDFTYSIISLKNGKHHCRECGKIVCDDCWGKLKYVATYFKEVNVCYICYK